MKAITATEMNNAEIYADITARVSLISIVAAGLIACLIAL